MNRNQNGEWETERIDLFPETSSRSKKRFSTGTLLSVVCISVLVAVMLTYTLTSAMLRGLYVAELQKKQVQLELLEDALGGVNQGKEDFGKLKYLDALIEQTSYYTDKVSREDRLNAVLKAYTNSLGDAYAEYFTEEEYQEILKQNSGQLNGIGVNVQKTTLTVEEYTYSVFRIISVFKNAPAADSGLRSSDCICAVKVDGRFLSVEELGGYTSAMNHIRGEDGTVVELMVFRQKGESYETLEFSVTRGSYVAESVSYTTLESDPTVGIVQIANFDLTTPTQFKAAVNGLLAGGVEHFVFDVRNNPGGDLMSIKAVLTYFLKEGDLILSSVDKEGNRVRSYCAETMALVGEYLPCSVAKREIGMYADLDAVVLCNGNTASAAEVFTATMRDYGIAPIVGETTFGKGIMQSVISLSDVSGRLYDGYIKLTTYAYVTKCGIPYHEIGVSPDEGKTVALSEEAKSYDFYFLPQSADNQLAAAVDEFD